MSDTANPATLDTAHPEIRREQFENAWRRRRAGEEYPRWEQFLPAPGELCQPDLIFSLIQVDLNFRIRAGLPALLSERYFEHPRLQEADCRLDIGRQVQLIRWEYQQRWQNGQRVRRGDYQTAFPQHADALDELRPSWCCPRCQQAVILEETVETLHCPSCDGEALTPGSPPFVADVTIATPEAPGLDLRGYALIERLGVGGMGEVYRSCDPALGRDVAVKVMKAPFQRNLSAERRFLREARVTGSLQHPGIVAVHNLGRLADGRLHYTMRLVRGGTLADILRDAPPGPERLTRLLAIFEKVCQAVAYAHSKQVIHRDLKPANVMVGKFGEVQVMDWGLAKLLSPADRAAAPEAAGTLIQTESADTPADLSRAGVGLGTPAYMPPEQALGEWELVDERADVFALGAILCEILTGDPPYRGHDGNEVLRRAQHGDVAEARSRLEQCGVDAALTGLCRECMTAEREDRPRDAGVVAERVAAYQIQVQERLRRAELERAQAEVKAREERKRRRLAMVLTAAVLLLVAGGVAGLWWQQRQHARHRQGVEAALSEVERLQQQARWAEARAVLEQAESRLGEAAVQDLRERVQQARRDLELVVRLDAIRLKRAMTIEGRFDYATADREYAEAFQEAGLGEEGEDSSAVAARIGNSMVRGALVAALDDWAGCTTGARRAWALEIARKADPGPERDRLRDLAMWNDGTALARLAGAQVAELSPQLLVVLGQRLVGLGRDAEPLLRAAQERYPADFWINFDLGNVLLKGKPGEAVGYYRAALALRPKTPAVHTNLGNALSDLRRLGEAVAEYKKAIALDPKLTQPYFNLGNTLQKLHRLDEAVAEYHKAIALKPKDASSHNNLGLVLHELRRLDEAVVEYHKAIALDSKGAGAHINLGNALHDKGRLEEAVVEYHKAIALDPKLAQPHYDLGRTLHELNRLEDAVINYQKAIALNSKDASSHNNLGLALYQLCRLDEAVAEFKKAITLDPKFSNAYAGLGQTLLQQGRFTEARQSIQDCLKRLPAKHSLRPFVSQQLRHCEQMIALDEKLPAILKGEAKPANATEQVGLGRLCQLRKRYAAAARFFAAAFAAQPKLADDPSASHRYYAACSAALAGAGQGEDATQLDDQERARLCRQARDWLRADLTAWARVVDKGPQARPIVQRVLWRWQRDHDLASLREPAALAKLPEGERQAWRQLWADVADLLKKIAPQP